MTPAERQVIVDVARLQVHEYFDHYLANVFPRQIDVILAGHNRDAEAHEPRFRPLMRAKQRFDRLIWLVIGGSTVIGAVGGFIASHLPQILKAILS